MNRVITEKPFSRHSMSFHYTHCPVLIIDFPKYTLREESFAILQFLAQFAKVCSRETFVIYKSRKFILAKK